MNARILAGAGLMLALAAGCQEAVGTPVTVKGVFTRNGMRTADRFEVAFVPEGAGPDATPAPVKYRTGAYEVENLPAGRYKVTVKRPGAAPNPKAKGRPVPGAAPNPKAKGRPVPGAEAANKDIWEFDVNVRKSQERDFDLK